MFNKRRNTMKNKQNDFIGFRTEKGIKEKIEKMAEEQEITVSKLINRLLKEVIQEKEKEKTNGYN